MFVRHHHRQLDVNVDSTHVINIGSASLSLPPDLDAGYVLLDTDHTGHTLEFRSVAYDREAVAQVVFGLKHPGAEYIAGHLRGQRPESVGERARP